MAKAEKKTPIKAEVVELNVDPTMFDVTATLLRSGRVKVVITPTEEHPTMTDDEPAVVGTVKGWGEVETFVGAALSDLCEETYTPDDEE